MATANKKPQPTSKKKTEETAKSTPATGQDPITGRFLAGNPLGVGRPKGYRAALNELAGKTMLDVYERLGQPGLEKLAREDPGKFHTLVVALLPKQLTGEGDNEPIKVEVTQGISSLEALLDAIRAKEEARAAAESDEG